MKAKLLSEHKVIENDINMLVKQADNLITNTIKNVNHELINMYWSVGKLVNDYRKTHNSIYGDSVCNVFAEKLSLKYGKGFNHRNIERMCLFNSLFNFATTWSQSNKTYSEFENISWSHIRELLRFKDIKIINFYLNEIENKKLTVKQLLSSIKSRSFERTVINQRRGKIKNEIERTLKDPVILNVENKQRTEKELEDEIVKNIFTFMDEIGSNISLFKRQYKININGLTHKVDLVFIDNDINSYILVDLKTGKVANKDILQMQMYIEYFGKEKNKKGFTTTGLILCETKDSRLIEHDSIYQIKYLNEMPKDKKLQKIINENKIILLKTEKLQIETASIN